MAAGEKRWSMQGKTPAKRTFEPVPSKDWDTKILGDTAEVKKSPEPGKFPYVQFAVECMGSALSEGGKNRRIYVNLYTKLTAGKDGRSMTERADQVAGLLASVGQKDTTSFSVRQGNDAEGNEHDYLDPVEIKKWVQSLDGTIVRLHSKIRRDKDHGDKAEVDYFIEADDAPASAFATGLEESPFNPAKNGA